MVIKENNFCKYCIEEYCYNPGLILSSIFLSECL